LKLGISTWSLLGLDVYSAVKAIGDAGAEYVELWGELPHAYPGWVNKKRLLDVLSSYDMALTVHAPFTDLNPAAYDPAVRDGVAAVLKSVVDLSAELGASVLTVHPGRVHNVSLVSGSEQLAVQTIRAVVRAARGRLTVSIENQTKGSSPYDYPLGSTLGSMEEILSDAGGTGWTLDTGHAHASGSLLGMAARLGDRLAEVHLSDNSGAADDHLAPGEGSAPLNQLMKKVAKTDAFVCLELNPHVYGTEGVIERYERAKLAFG
jgi:sugar phosphate isomerase/epimerase